jgi:hypothetical protein
LESWSKNKIPELAIQSVSKISNELYEQNKEIRDAALILDWMYKGLSAEIDGGVSDTTNKKGFQPTNSADPKGRAAD